MVYFLGVLQIILSAFKSMTGNDLFLCFFLLFVVYWILKTLKDLLWL